MWRPGTPRSLRQESCEGDTRPAAIARRHGTKSSQGGGLELQSGYALPPFQATASRLTLIDAQSHLDCRAADFGDIPLDRARRVGPNARAWAERCFAARDFPEQAFATVQGMIRLAKDHGGARLEALCAEALDLNRLASGFLRERLKNGAGLVPPRPEAEETIPDHGNVRHADILTMPRRWPNRLLRLTTVSALSA